MSNKITIDLDNILDQKELQHEVQERIVKMAKTRMETAINAFFRDSKEMGYKPGTNQWTQIRVTGPGTDLLEQKLTEIFDNPKTQERMEKFFNENFGAIMEKCMTKAIQHQCNKKFFKDARILGINND